MLFNHWHIVTPATVSVETDTSTCRFARKLHVTVRSEELEARQLQHRVRYRFTQSRLVVKHKTEDEELSNLKNGSKFYQGCFFIQTIQLRTPA